MLRVALSIWLVLLAPLPAQVDRSFGTLQSTMRSIRENAAANPRAGARGATAQTTIAKHQLRDWIETRLTPWQPGWDEKDLERRVNASLKGGKLFCPDGDDSVCVKDGFNATGYLGDVHLHYDRGLLRVTTRIGILCGYDESAYLYEWKDKRWRRIWQTEQNNYAKYDPQTIKDVIVSSVSDDRDARLVLSLGSYPWCSSNWQMVYYRLWRVDQAGSRLLLDKKDGLYLGAHDPPVIGTIREHQRSDTGDADNVIVEYADTSIDGAVHNREHVRQYAVLGDKVERVAPVALSPRDFVDEWLSLAKSESQAWSQRSAVTALGRWHDKLHSDRVSGDFISATRHCSQPDLWQVGLEMRQRYGNANTPATQDYYFTVRWRPPYDFTMMAISEQPTRACNQPDPVADQRRTLFPNWR
jgi:hypothetical protein